jgi:hypothetical protein
LLDLRIGRFQEGVCDLSQGFKFHILDIFTCILGETEQKDRTVRAKANKQAKASSFAFSRPRHTLFDDASTEVPSISPRTARSTAATRLESGMSFWRVNLASGLVLKIRKPVLSFYKL